MSVIYEVNCDKCGERVRFKVALDKDDDLIVRVQPCEKCFDKRFEDGKAVERETIREEMGEASWMEKSV